ncbi:hypothetical protein [Escherichia coli]|uniref:hypothetical protein n=1 Tax=Escherichia coli TaxID=562 RepID=UPI002034E7B2|nr:hypothetical protein [Escherichia coli]
MHIEEEDLRALERAVELLAQDTITETLTQLVGTTAAWRLQIENRPGSSCCCRTPRRICML